MEKRKITLTEEQKQEKILRMLKDYPKIMFESIERASRESITLAAIIYDELFYKGKEDKIEAKVINYLYKLGISKNLKGFDCLNIAILVHINESENYTITEIYKEVSIRCNISPDAVERNIRTAKKRAWKKGNQQLLHKLFYNEPTNSELIARVSDIISRELL